MWSPSLRSWREYLVHWKGWPRSQATGVRLEDLWKFQEQIQQYLQIQSDEGRCLIKWWSLSWSSQPAELGTQDPLSSWQAKGYVTNSIKPSACFLAWGLFLSQFFSGKKLVREFAGDVSSVRHREPHQRHHVLWNKKAVTIWHQELYSYYESFPMSFVVIMVRGGWNKEQFRW